MNRTVCTIAAAVVLRNRPGGFGGTASGPAGTRRASRGIVANSRKRLAEAEQKIRGGKAADVSTPPTNLQRILDEIRR